MTKFLSGFECKCELCTCSQACIDKSYSRTNFHPREGSNFENFAVDEVSTSYNVEGNNCTNITISTNNNKDTSSNDDVVVEADHCANLTINKGHNITYLKHHDAIIIGSVIATAFVLALFMYFALLFFKSKHRRSSEATVDTSQAPVADAMNIKFRNPPGRFTRLRNYFKKCCGK